MASDIIQSGNKRVATTPGGWEELMRPVAEVGVREVRGRQFYADLQLFTLPRTAIFSLKLPSARVVVPEGAGFVAVNILASGQIHTAAPSRGSVWETGKAHVVNHDNCRFEFTSDEHFESMSLCFHNKLIEEYSRKFYGRDCTCLKQGTADLTLESNAGACFSRFAKFVWGELNRDDAFLQSSFATVEIEDSLWSLLLSAIGGVQSKSASRTGGYATYVKSAEEYILGNLDTPLRVADIAEAAGASVPTLNRAFRKCHGIGPKAFAKRRRLERVRSDILSADPRTSSVTSIARKYGFWHMSQFAADYKRAFRETPSEAMRRR